MLFSIICVCVCIYLVYTVVCHRYAPQVNHLVPTQSGRLPIIGHAHKFLRIEELCDLVKTWSKFNYEHGGVSTVFLGPYPLYMVSDPEDALTVLQKCLDKFFMYHLIEPFLGKMLVAAEVPVWKRSRRIIDLSFTQKLLDDYLKVFNGEAERLVQALEEDVGKGEIDVTEKITRSVLETTCRTTMGATVDGKDLVNDKYVLAVDTFMEIITIKFCKPWYLLEPIFNLSGYRRKLEESSEIFFSLSEKMVKLRKEEHLQRLKNKEDFDFCGSRFQSFLDVLLENSVTETSSTFTDSEIRNLVDNVLLAAFDTTICELILVLVCLGSHPQVQDKIYQEIIDVMGEKGKVSKENLSSLIYLEAAIKETLRLYPIALLVGRQASTEVKLSNATIPAGSSLIVNIWALNRNPKYWGEDADEFKPERWLSDSLPEHPAAFASFSPGRRGCPGKQYTFMMFKATLAPLITRYKFTADHTNMKLDFKVMLKPRSGHHIKIEYR